MSKLASIGPKNSAEQGTMGIVTSRITVFKKPFKEMKKVFVVDRVAINYFIFLNYFLQTQFFTKKQFFTGGIAAAA